MAIAQHALFLPLGFLLAGCGDSATPDTAQSGHRPASDAALDLDQGLDASEPSADDGAMGGTSAGPTSALSDGGPSSVGGSGPSPADPDDAGVASGPSDEDGGDSSASVSPSDASLGPEAPADAGDSFASLEAEASERCESEPVAACNAGQVHLSDLRIDDTSGDGLLSPGEEATVAVKLTNASASEPSVHCLALIADRELIVLGSQNVADVAWACGFDAVPAGGTTSFTWQVQVDPSAPASASLRLVVYVSQGQTACACSDTPWLLHTVTIQ